jgi:hypothetical protein
VVASWSLTPKYQTRRVAGGGRGLAKPVSLSGDLAHDLSAQTRKISPLYKQIFPGTVLDKSAVDDPVHPEDALSERVKQQLRDWVNSSIYTRFNDPSQGALVPVIHRLAPDDLSGAIEPYRRFCSQAALDCRRNGKKLYPYG